MGAEANLPGNLRHGVVSWTAFQRRVIQGLITWDRTAPLPVHGHLQMSKK
jgi:hypothetical protein